MRQHRSNPAARMVNHQSSGVRGAGESTLPEQDAASMGCRNATVEPEIVRQQCTGCGACVTACHVDALALVGSTVAVVAASRCDYCGVCEAICPVEAIRCPYLITFNISHDEN